MRQEANPRKFLCRAPDYGASPAAITVSHCGLFRLTVATSSASRVYRGLKSSNSTTQHRRQIGGHQLLETSVTHSKQITAIRSDRYFFCYFDSSQGRLPPVAQRRRSKGFCPATTARAN